MEWGCRGDNQTREASRWLQCGLCPIHRCSPGHPFWLHGAGRGYPLHRWSGEGVRRSPRDAVRGPGGGGAACATTLPCDLEQVPSFPSLFIYKMGKKSRHKFDQISQAPPGSEIRSFPSCSAPTLEGTGKRSGPARGAGPTGQRLPSEGALRGRVGGGGKRGEGGSRLRRPGDPAAGE